MSAKVGGSAALPSVDATKPMMIRNKSRKIGKFACGMIYSLVLRRWAGKGKVLRLKRNRIRVECIDRRGSLLISASVKVPVFIKLATGFIFAAFASPRILTVKTHILIDDCAAHQRSDASSIPSSPLKHDWSTPFAKRRFGGISQSSTSLRIRDPGVRVAVRTAM